MAYRVLTGNGIFHSNHTRLKDAIDQADMIHGAVEDCTCLICVDCDRRETSEVCDDCGEPLCDRCAGRDRVGAEIAKRHNWTPGLCAACTE